MVSLFDGVIFDFNGVLLWDNHLHEEAWRRFSAELRGYPLDDEEMRRQVHGRTNLDIFAYVLGRAVSRHEVQPLMDEKETIYRRLALEAIDDYRLSPGAVELLDDLAAAYVPRAIATSSPGVNVAFFIEHLDLHRWFAPEHIIYDRGLYPGKPAPDIYLEAAERLGLPPGRCVVVEDSIAGIQSARDAGCGIVAIGPAAEHAALASLPGVGAVIEELGGFPRAWIQDLTGRRPEVVKLS
jgi:HAD superfamily hydrolase (TIGR01509 family)